MQTPHLFQVNIFGVWTRFVHKFSLLVSHSQLCKNELTKANSNIYFEKYLLSLNKLIANKNQLQYIA